MTLGTLVVLLLATTCYVATGLHVAHGGATVPFASASNRCGAHQILACEEPRPEKTDGYLEGMFTSALDFRSDEELDNLTPNVKFVAGSALVVVALLGLFVASNAPPPAAYTSMQ